jgi:hypothetical protein
MTTETATLQESLQSATAERDLARLKLETLRASSEAELVKKAYRPLLEEYELPPDPFRYSDPIDPASYPRRSVSRTLMRDRADGRYFPYYETEMDLARMRSKARTLQAYFPRIVGALETLGNYVFGQDGASIKAMPKNKEKPPQDLLDRCNAVIEKFTDDNDWYGSLDRESDERARTDGECIWTLHERSHGIDVEIPEPDNLTEPAHSTNLNQHLDLDFRPCWKFGVLRRRKHTASRPLGYHFYFPEDEGQKWQFMKPSHVEHVKRNAIRTAKRGVSDFFSNEADAKDEQKLRHNTAVGASVQAAIAFIRQHAKGASQDGIDAFVSAGATDSYRKGVSGGQRSVNVEELQPGTVKDIPEGMEYQAGPMGQLRSPVFIEVAQFVLRALGNRWGMPEYMISGDASNANFASTLVAEAPFVKARERDQGFYLRSHLRLFWKVLKIAWGQGWLGNYDWQEIRSSVELKADFPSVASRDEAKQVQTDTALYGLKVKTRRTIAGEHNLDFDEEVQTAKQDGDWQEQPQPDGQPGMGSLTESLLEEQEERLMRFLAAEYP